MTQPGAVETRTEEHAFDPPDAESSVDLRLLQIVEQYAQLVGAGVQRTEPHLLGLTLPLDEAQHFRGRRAVTVAFSLAALERHPDAEMAVVGSGFVQDLLDAVRTRGFRRDFGLLPPQVAPSDAGIELAVPATGMKVGSTRLVLAVHEVGRLVARVAIKSGAVGEERVVVSGVFDLTAGIPVTNDIARLCSDVEAGRIQPSNDNMRMGAETIPVRPMDELLPLIFSDLHSQLADQLTRRRTEAQRALAAEVGRLDRYYGDLLQEAAEGTDAELSPRDRRAIEVERDRRKAEEQRRYEVRVAVHPLQLVEFGLLVQRAEWQLETPSGLKGTIAGQRALSGAGTWVVACPTCGRAPKDLRVCRQNHVTCADCSKTCGVCDEAFCNKHGIDSCHVDGAPACTVHARRCPACRRAHCSTHEGECSEGGHKACTACLSACGVCGRIVCTTHGLQSGPATPKGARRLCHNCAVYCEGGTNEPVGRDEVTRCASCEKSVCTLHQALCAVDQQVHCSKHLRRADRSRRLTCEHHRAQCSLEAHVMFASDEVAACATCARAVCDQHGAVCVVDGLRHCSTHLARLHDTPSDQACEKHRSVCHIDQRSYTLTGTAACLVCGRLTCAEHLRPCGWCGRAVCAAELPPREPRCTTCRHLAEVADPSDSLIAASVTANEGEPPQAKSWRVGRDATHEVAELDLGWSRRLVFAVRHSDNRPDVAMRHSLLGSSRLK